MNRIHTIFASASKRAPLIVALFAVAATVVLAWLDWEAEQQHQTRELRRHGDGLGVGLTVLAAQYAGKDDELGANIAAHLIVQRPILAATVARGRRVLAEVKADADPGSEPVTETATLTIPIGTSLPRRGPAPRDRPPRPRVDESGPREQRPRPWLWRVDGPPGERPQGPLTLTVVLDATVPPHVRDRQLVQTALALLLAWATIGALSFAWSRMRRARALGVALAAESVERQRLAEMNLTAAGVAHETRNPLGLILGLAQRLAASPAVDDFSRDTAEQIIDEADRAASRLTDFVNFASRRAPNLSDVRLDSVVSAVCETLRADFEQAGVRLTVAVAPSLVHADKGMVEQVLVNLLLNSVQAALASPAAGATTTVTLAVAHGQASLSLEDNAGGIPPELLAKIFVPYVTGRADGHGLGLAIVKRITDDHGWDIAITSVLGAGTTVRVSQIPVVAASTMAPSPGLGEIP